MCNSSSASAGTPLQSALPPDDGLVTMRLPAELARLVLRVQQLRRTGVRITIDTDTMELRVHGSPEKLSGS